MKPLLFLSRISYPIYLTHYLIIGVAVLLLSAASVAPLVAANNSTPTSNILKNTTYDGKTHHKNYTLYFITMAAPCPAGVKMESDITAWAKAHPYVEFHILPQESPQGIKYDARLSPTTVMLDKATGKVVGRWVGIFDLAKLTTIYNGG